MSAPGALIVVHNRYSGATEQEPVFGERWLRWTYETAAGRATLALLVKRAWFSRVYGRRMSRPRSAARIGPFVERYRIDASEFADPVDTFASFNDFFARKLKPSARPVAADPGTVVFPADGRHLGFADGAAAGRVYAKGQWLDLRRLLGDDALARRFEHGSLVISRLCPIDYHRFHFPCAARASAPRLIPGSLFSVNPIALRRTLDYLLENKRVVSCLDAASCGLVVMVEIGATCVGSIDYTFLEGPVQKGEEKGAFRFGGSCVITLFEPGRVQLDADLVAQSAAGRELYAHMGDRMGTMTAG